MKQLFQLLIVSTLLYSCTFNKKKELFFLNKNTYDIPVWEEMLQQERVKFSDVELAFKAYASTHNLDKETLEHFEKLEKRSKQNLDGEGYYWSKLGQYKQLLKFRKALPNNNRAKTDYTVSVNTSVTKGVPNNNSYGKWRNVGPFGNPEVHWSATGNGAIQHLEMHPTNPAIMYASSRNGGLWKTINYGKNWTPETDYFATNNTSCVEVCPANPSVFYLGAAEDQKIWYSSDAGVSWEDRSTGLTGKVFDIHSDPTDETRAIAATADGIFLTTDAGLTWTQKLSGRYTDIDITDNWDLIIVSDDDKDITPVLNFSKDKGDTFIEKNIITHLTEVDRFYIGIHKPNSGATQVFAYGLIDGNTPTRFIGFWKSDYDPNPADGTSYFNFTEVKHPTHTYPNGAVPLAYADNTEGFTEETSDYYGSINPYSQATWISDFYVSPNNPDRMLTLREKFWGSDDGGIIWKSKPSYGGSNWADNRFVTNNVAKDTVFWCNDGGMWAIKENDLFPTEAEITASGLSEGAYVNSKVVSKNGDICVSEGTQMDVSQTNKGVFITGGQDIGQIFTRNGRDTHAASADVYRGRIKPSDDSKFITGRIDVKLDGGTDVFRVYNNIEADYFNADRIYGFTNKNATQDVNEVRLVRSPTGADGWDVKGFKGEHIANGGGHSWVPTNDNWETVSITSTGITDLKPGTFEQSKADKNLAFLGDEIGGKLFYTENLSDANPTWTQLPNAPIFSRYRIATHQYNKNIIAIATNNGVYLSKNKGETWVKKGNFPENNPKAILIDKTTTEGIYVLTELTVYYIDETLTEWVEFNKGLPLQNLSDMRIAYYPNNDNRLYVSKYGRGVWNSSLQSSLEQNGDNPIADFSIHGNSVNQIFVGEFAQLIDQSSNATNLEWTLENGADIITISDELTPEVQLNTPGYYKVTLVSTNANGSDTQIKEQYILVLAPPTTPDCVLTSTGKLSWWNRINNIKINDETYVLPNSYNYIQSNKNFEFIYGESNSFYIEDNYAGSTQLYYKAWIDYNNDGDFDDANEEIVSSGGQVVDNFTANFVVPANATAFQPLTMRVTGIDSATAPTSCQITGTRQTVDFTVTIKNLVEFTQSHTILSENSANLQASFTNGSIVNNGGFVYSRFDAELTTDNSNSTYLNTTLSNDDSFSTAITNLEYNTMYYYRPFIKDQYGTHYGEKQSFQLAPYAIPMAESLIPSNLGSNQWELKGIIYPEDIVLDELYLEYGTTDFSNSASYTPASFDESSSYVISTSISTTLGESYQFRVKMISNGKTYYSNVYTFNTDQTICTPIVNKSEWFKRIKNVTFDGNSNNSKGNTGYEDFTNIIYNVTEGSSYTISITDSYSPGFNLDYVVFIDYNNDGDFDDYHEVASQGTPNDETYNGTITIPETDIIYNTNLAMRIIGYSGSMTSCEIQNGEIEDYSIKISYKNNFTASTGNWSDSSNWTIGRVPTSTDDVVIKENSTVNVDIENAVANDLIVESGGTLNINKGKGLTINGDLTQSGVFVINSSADSNGSLIVKGEATGNVTYKRYLTTSVEDKKGWHLIGAPVNGQDIVDFKSSFLTNSVRKSIAPYVNTVASTSCWGYYTIDDSNSISSAGDFIKAKGYSAKLSTAGTLNFTGTLSTNDESINISDGSSNNSPGNRWNLIANPYTAAINGNTLAHATNNFLKVNIDGGKLDTARSGLYLWDGVKYVEKSIDDAAFYIAPGQGFFVYAKEGETTSVSFTEAMQTHQTGDVYLKNSISYPEMVLQISNNVKSESTKIRYIEGKTNGLDIGSDIGVFTGTDNSFKVFTRLVDRQKEEVDFAIQALSSDAYENTIIPVGVYAKEGEKITFTLNKTNLASEMKVFLEDKVTGIATRLDVLNTSYTAIYEGVSSEIDRFYLRLEGKSLNTDSQIALNSISMYTTDNQTLKIVGLNKDRTVVKIYNSIGEEVMKEYFISDGDKEISLEKLVKGIYIVQLQVKDKTLQKKVIIY